MQDGAAESPSVDDSLSPAIAATYVAATGVLTLTGSDTLANYQAVLRTLQYNHTSQNPTTDDRKIEVVVNDGTNDSNVATSTVSIVAQNDSPNLTLASGGLNANNPGSPLAPLIAFCGVNRIRWIWISRIRLLTASSATNCSVA